jgi:Cu(I)/Ag(I) efflux system protein CusF
MKSLIALALVCASTLSLAQSGGMKDMPMNETKSSAKSHHAVGVVKSVDADKGTVTLDHGPVASMNWPAMTMTFKADKKMLGKLAAGQKVEADFVQRGKDYVIIKMK